MFGLKFSLAFVLKVVYGIFVNRIPGLAILVPMDFLMRIVEALKIGLGHPLIVDWKFSNIHGLMKFATELMQAAVYKTDKEVLEAVYAILVYLTNLETLLSKEQFIEMASKPMSSEPTGNVSAATDLLPAGDVFPDDDMEKACEPHTLAA